MGVVECLNHHLVEPYNVLYEKEGEVCHICTHSIELDTMECNIHDVTSGVSQKLCWGIFSIIIYGNMAYIQTAAASRTGEIPSCLDTNPECQHWPFNVGTPVVSKELGENSPQQAI